MRVEHTVSFLELTDLGQLRAARPRSASIALEPRSAADLTELRELYSEIGAPHHWLTRPRWTDAQWAQWLSRAGVRPYVAQVGKVAVGLVELEVQESGNVELVVFGLKPDFVGQGLGGPLLVEAVEQARSLGARRLHLHTSSLDHPHALRNYEARGFRRYATERKFKELPDEC